MHPVWSGIISRLWWQKTPTRLSIFPAPPGRSRRRLDADTFAINPATAENVQCKTAGEDGDATLVSCTGKLVLDYNGEKQEIDLADRTYRVVQEGGEWRMCGYK